MAKDINDLNTAITNLETAVKNAPPPAPAPDFTEQVARIDAVTAAIPAPVVAALVTAPA